MKKLILVPLLIAASPAVFATSGQVTFSGAIVNETCQSLNAQRTALSCARNGGTQTLPVQFTANTQTLPYNLGHVRTSAQRSVQIVTVQYH